MEHWTFATSPARWRKPRLVIGDDEHNDGPQAFVHNSWHRFMVVTTNPDKVWSPFPGILAVPVSTQADADRLVPALLSCPARWRAVVVDGSAAVDLERWLSAKRLYFVGASVEGLLRSRDFAGILDDNGRELPATEAETLVEELHRDGWKVIPAEGCDCDDAESGCSGHDGPLLDLVIIAGPTDGRPCDLAHVRSIRDQCVEAGVPFQIARMGSLVVSTLGYGCWVPLPMASRTGADPADWPKDLRPYAAAAGPLAGGA